jgi:uncharacterized protein YbjT (DUF2867 family)
LTRVLLLGPNGFIGSSIARQLLSRGYEVLGLGRGRPPLAPALGGWIGADLNGLTNAEAWVPHLRGVDAVVNASGALQTGARDRLGESQGRAIVALVAACEEAGVARFVQISAPGATLRASTEFMRTKATADARLRASSLDWTILRPGLVIGRDAYGGTALIRALAAFPLILPLVRPCGRIQTVAMDDVARIAAMAVAGEIGPRLDLDLVEAQPHEMREIVLAHRAWLGVKPPLAVVEFPGAFARPIGWLADALGWLGWRSPLRSTALKVMREDVLGDPEPARAVLGREFTSLAQTLATLSSAAQDRIQARLFLLLPLIVASLAILWIGSGVIGLVRTDEAASVLSGHGMDEGLALQFVRAGSVADLVLGTAILVRRTARPAALGMAALTLAYVAGAFLVRPDLWLDPLGAMLKTLPALILALVAWAALEER